MSRLPSAVTTRPPLQARWSGRRPSHATTTRISATCSTRSRSEAPQSRSVVPVRTIPGSLTLRRDRLPADEGVEDDPVSRQRVVRAYPERRVLAVQGDRGAATDDARCRKGLSELDG